MIDIVDFTDVFKIVVRWAHMVSAAAWVGGSLFWLLVLKPSMKNRHSDTSQTDQGLGERVAKEFRSLVDTCVFVLLATGVIMTLDRLTPGEVGANYVLVLGIKIIFVAIMFYIIRAKRQSNNLLHSRHNKQMVSKKVKLVRMLSGYNLLVVLGLLVFLLSDLLSFIYYSTQG